MDWAFPDAANELQPLKYPCWCLFARAPILDCLELAALAVVVLVGNKTDLAEDRLISEEEGQEYATL